LLIVEEVHHEALNDHVLVGFGVCTIHFLEIELVDSVHLLREDILFRDVFDQGHDQSNSAHGVDFIAVFCSVVECLANEPEDFLKGRDLVVDALVEILVSLGHVVNQRDCSLAGVLNDV